VVTESNFLSMKVLCLSSAESVAMLYKLKSVKWIASGDTSTRPFFGEIRWVLKRRKPVNTTFHELSNIFNYLKSGGPNIFAESFLHVYFLIVCRRYTGKEQTNVSLSWMVLSKRHSLRLQHSVFVLSRRQNVVTDKPAPRP